MENNIINKMNQLTKNERFTKNSIFILKICLIISTAVFPLFMNLMSGIGWISTYTRYSNEIRTMGIIILISSALMTLALIFCLLKFNLFAIFTECLGFTVTMTVLTKMMNYADNNGWSNQITMQPASDLYRNRILPTIIPFVLLITIALLQYFSYEEKVKRKIKREEKEKKENMTAPKIIND